MRAEQKAFTFWIANQQEGQSKKVSKKNGKENKIIRNMDTKKE